MAPTYLKELQERFSLCHVRLTSCMINLISVMHDQSSLAGHVQSTFSLSCTINLLSSCTINLLSSCTIKLLSSCMIKLLSVMYDQPSLVLYDQPSLVMYDQPSLVMYDQPALCHVRSTFSRSCTVNLLSSCTISPIRIRTRRFIVSVQVYKQLFLRCIVSAQPVAAELCHLPLPLVCHVRSTFFLSCTNNLIMYDHLSLCRYDPGSPKGNDSELSDETGDKKRACFICAY